MIPYLSKDFKETTLVHHKYDIASDPARIQAAREADIILLEMVARNEEEFLAQDLDKLIALLK